MSTLPFLPAPTKASKKWNPSPRSSRMKNCEEAMNGDVLMYQDRKSTRLNSSHGYISYAVFCLKKKNKRDSLKSAQGKPPAHLHNIEVSVPVNLPPRQVRFGLPNFPLTLRGTPSNPDFFRQRVT